MKRMLVLLLSLLLLTPVLADELLQAEDFTLRLTDSEDAPVFAIGDPAQALLDALADYTGAPVQMTFEDQDCMLPGMTREYLTADEMFVLATRPLPGDAKANTLESVMVLTDAVVTRRGAKVGMTLAEIEALYGAEYALDYDTVFYSNGDFEPQLMFFFDTESWRCIGWMIFRNMVI
ncbi:MAG: hypothetical protein E7327_07125 [Clostridiales bacterium]|nr:hypothetical protein [Clostridiales bacterium]